MKLFMRPKLAIAGYFGAGNVGDEAILSAEIQSLKSYFDLMIVSLDPEYTMKTHKIDCAKLPSLSRPREIMRFFRYTARCDGLVIGGGGFLPNRLQPFSIYNWLLLISITKLLRKKVILFSVGCGPFRNGIHSIHIRYVLNKADIILLRDSISEHILKQVIKINTPTRVTADVAFLLARAAQKKKLTQKAMENVFILRNAFYLVQIS
jgi:polysaccharide pyruvyl transferase WcaK-like protein